MLKSETKTAAKQDVIGEDAHENDHHPLLKEFTNPRFSDVSVIALGKTWQLHRLILVQSPLLRKKIEDGADVIALDLTFWPQVAVEGLEVKE
jgi:hypothetical protein